jgi:hypothetical protein
MQAKTFNMKKNNQPVDVFRMVFIALGIIAFLSVGLYAIGSLAQMSAVTPDGFIPKSLDSMPKPSSRLLLLSPVFVLVYAFSFLPVIVQFTIAKFKTNPYGSVLAACLLVTGCLLEIVNALPMVSMLFAHQQIAPISPEIMLYLKQTEAIRFLAYDVAGFTLAYAGLFVFAVMFRKSNPWFSGLIISSIVLFIANVPFLWIVPSIAVILMALSIFVFSILPLLMVRMTLNENDILLLT